MNENSPALQRWGLRSGVCVKSRKGRPKRFLPSLAGLKSNFRLLPSIKMLRYFRLSLGDQHWILFVLSRSLLTGTTQTNFFNFGSSLSFFTSSFTF